MPTLAFAQLEPSTPVDGICAQAARQGADILLFPEMWNIGYGISEEEPEVWLSRALTLDSAYVESLCNLARRHDIAILTTLLEATAEGARNTALLFDRTGSIVLKYAKVHTCDFAAERHLSPGDGFRTCTLETKTGPVKVGIMICFDREFPESARILMLEGAELILTPNACPMEINRLCQLRSRAYENMLAIATCNYPEGVGECNGASTLFDGIAYSEEGSRDMCVFKAGSGSGLFTAFFDLEALRAYRRSEVHGNCYRHPEVYGMLIDKKVEEPFIRSDRRV